MMEATVGALLPASTLVLLERVRVLGLTANSEPPLLPLLVTPAVTVVVGLVLLAAVDSVGPVAAVVNVLIVMVPAALVAEGEQLNAGLAAAAGCVVLPLTVVLLILTLLLPGVVAAALAFVLLLL